MKENYLSYLEKLEKLLANTSFASEIATTKEKISHKQLLVPVVGGFSAGKSTIINSMLGGGVLPTSIEPTTSAAAELCYSEDEYILAYDAYDEKHTGAKFPIEQLPELATSCEKYSYLQVFLNNPALKQIQPLRVVDMPGFASGNEFHESVLGKHLLKNSAYYMLLQQAERGTIETEIINQLNEITKNKKGFTLCLSKIEACADVASVKASIKEQLSALYDYDKDVLELRIDDGEVFKQALRSIDIGKIFKMEFQEKLQSQNHDFRNGLDRQNKALSSDAEDLQKEIQAIKNKQNEKKSKEPVSPERVKQLCDEAAQSVIAAILNELEANKPNLLSKLAGGSDIKADIDRILKTTAQSSMQEAVANLQASLIDDYKGHFLELSNELDMQFLDTSALNDIASRVQEKINDDISMGTVITAGLSILAGFLSPVLKGLAAAAPVIINLIANFLGFGSNPSHDEKSAKAAQVLNDAMRSIKDNINASVPSAVKENISGTISLIKEKFDAEVADTLAQLEQSLSDKSGSKEQIDEKINLNNERIAQLEALYEQHLKG